MREFSSFIKIYFGGWVELWKNVKTKWRWIIDKIGTNLYARNSPPNRTWKIYCLALCKLISIKRNAKSCKKPQLIQNWKELRTIKKSLFLRSVGWMSCGCDKINFMCTICQKKKFLCNSISITLNLTRKIWGRSEKRNFYCAHKLINFKCDYMRKCQRVWEKRSTHCTYRE